MIIKADLHVHTTASDGKNSIDELIAEANARGLDAIAVSDHNMCTPLPECDLLLIPGAEISTESGHVLGLFVRDIDFASICDKGLPSARDAVSAIHRSGGLAVLAHPFERKSFQKNELDSVDFDFIETANSRAVMKFRDANEKAVSYAEFRRLPAVGGSDAHSSCELGGSYTEIECAGIRDIETALRDGRTKAVFVRGCSWFTKAKTRLFVARKTKNKKKILKSYLYLIYAAARDIFNH